MADAEGYAARYRRLTTALRPGGYYLGPNGPHDANGNPVAPLTPDEIAAIGFGAVVAHEFAADRAAHVGIALEDVARAGRPAAPAEDAAPAPAAPKRGRRRTGTTSATE